MEFDNLKVLLLHKHPEYLKETCDLINDEWPRSETARLTSLQASRDNLPSSLILVNDKKLVLGHCKLTPIPSIPESCFVETVVISKAFRGMKLGTYLMRKVEEHCKNNLDLSMLHLSTKGQESFYEKLGYEICMPVSIYGTRMPSYSLGMITLPIYQEPIHDNKLHPSIRHTAPSHMETQVPVRSPHTTGAPPPPPPPPMPRNENLINNNDVKSNKTFMFKYLR